MFYFVILLSAEAGFANGNCGLVLLTIVLCDINIPTPAAVEFGFQPDLTHLEILLSASNTFYCAAPNSTLCNTFSGDKQDQKQQNATIVKSVSSSILFAMR